jgi:hypothetical protein
MQPIRRTSVKASWIFLALLFAAGTAFAQTYKWVDADGKVRYGDAPPPGAKTSTIKAPPPGSAAPATAAKDAKKGPLTAAEQEKDYRKRQEEAGKAADKANADLRAQAERNEVCARQKESLATLESGQRISRTDAKGERYYLDENQVAQEIAKTRQSMQQACK